MVYIKYFLATFLAIVFSMTFIHMGIFAVGFYGGKINIITTIILSIIGGIISGVTACSIATSLIELFTGHKKNQA